MSPQTIHFWVLEKSPVQFRPWKVSPSLQQNQSRIFIGRTFAEAEVPILWPPNMKNWLLRKDPDAGKDWRQKEKGTTEDELVGWHHQLNGDEFEQALVVGNEWGNLACYNSWGCEESDMTEWLSCSVLFRTEFHRLMSKRIIASILEKGLIPRNWAIAYFWSLMVHFGTVTVPLGVSFSMLVCYSENILRIKV